MRRVIVTVLTIVYSCHPIIAQEPKLMLPIGHTAGINSALFSPDGKRIITASADNTAKIWDANSGTLIADLKTAGKPIIDNIDVSASRLIHDLKAYDGNVILAQFSPDGKRIVTVSFRMVNIWNANTGEWITSLKGQISNITFAEFSHDSRKIITSTGGGMIDIWDSNTGSLIIHIKGQSNWVNSAKFSWDDKKIVTASQDRTAKVWDAGTGVLLADLKGHTGAVNSAMFSRDGKKILTFSDDYTARIWDANSGLLLTNMKGHKGVLYSAALSEDEKKVVTASHDNTSKIWDANTGVLLVDLIVRNNKAPTMYFGVRSANFSPDDKEVITACADGVKIWDANTGTLLSDLNGHTKLIRGAEFSPDGKKIITASLDNTAKIWDASNRTLLLDLKGNTKSVNFAQFSPDGKLIATASDDSTVKIWDTNTGVLLGYFKGHNDVVNSVQFSPDGKKLVTTAGSLFSGKSDTVAKIWDINTGGLLGELKGHKYSLFSAKFSPDGKRITTESRDGTIRKWDVNTTTLEEASGPYSTGWASLDQVSPDGKKIARAMKMVYPRAEIFDTRTDTLLFELKGHTQGLLSLQFTPDGTKIITTSMDKTAKIWSANTGVLLADLKGHADRVISAQFSPNGKRIITASQDNTSKVWDAYTGDLLYTFFAVDSTDYFYLIPSGYYMCTPNAAKLLHYVTTDLKVITFEQLDVKYNRPDLVLKAIGCTDTALIESYRKAYFKRIQKLGFDTSFFKGGLNIPEADIQNRNEIAGEQNLKELSLHIRASDTSFNLDRLNIWINEVPMFGRKGINLRARTRKHLDTVITVTLSKNKNRVEFAVTNVGGLESYRMPLDVQYIPSEPVPEKTYFIGIGIDSFSKNWYNLQYSVKDIRDLSVKLKGKYKNNIRIDTLFNKNVTVSSVLELKERLLNTTENDKVIVSFSGHGLLSNDYDYFLSTYNLDFQHPEKDGLSYSTLEDLLDSIPARMKLMLIDACHSGELDKEELSKMKKVQQVLDSSIRGLNHIFDTSNNKFGMKNSFELMQEVFINVGKSTGASIISAASGTQFALERGDLKNGVFSYCILNAMEKYPTMKVSELKRIVANQVTVLTKGMQKPTFRNKTIYFDWDVW